MSDDNDPEKRARDAEEFVRLWFARIDARYDAKAWRMWREEAEACEKRYSLEQGARDKRFNIFYANVETVAAATYNSMPTPDVRRRYGDADPPGKIAADVLERGISASCDLYDFDDVMDNVVHDGEVVGIGMARVRFDTKFAEPQSMMGHNGGPEIDEAQDKGPQADGVEPSADEVQEGEPQQIAWQSVWCETVDWADVVWADATRWDAVEWVAFRHKMDREAIETLNPKVAEEIKLTQVEDERNKRTKSRNTQEETTDTDQRGEVWEIWHKPTRKVLFIARDWPAEPLAVKNDPLGLREFWPMPRPHAPVRKPHDLTPVPTYRLYADQAKELNEISRRITMLTAAARWRGVYDSTFATAFKEMEALDDGSLAPIKDAMAWKDKGLDAAIWLMPIDKIVTALRQLHEDRESVKQVIYEIIGVADIMRGTSAASETLGAQKLKTQWGSLRVSRRQRAVQRYARDLFRLKAEILGKRFAPQVLSMMTGIDLQPAPMPPMQPQIGPDGQPMPPDPQMVEAMQQAKAAGEALQILRGDMEREYRVDIETDSTIQADVQQAQTNASQFLQGLGLFAQGVGPAIQAGMMQGDEAADLLVSISRSFKLGRQGEDALERMGRRLSQQAKQPKQEKPSPEEIKAQAEAQKMQMEAGIRQNEAQMDAAAKQQDAQLKAQLGAADLQAKQQELAMREREMAMKAEISEREHAMRMAEMDRQAMMAERQHQCDMDMMAAKTQAAKEAMRKPRADA